MVKCPVCRRENPENALCCDECGSYLRGGSGKKTALLPVNGMAWMNGEETCGAPGVDVIYPLDLKLTILDSGCEVAVPLTREVNLGRLDPVSGSFPDVDLTDYGGVDKGVSRRHAKVIRRGSEVFIEDLGSFNGTFLNGRRLPPHCVEALESGGELQLSKLALRVSFTE
jgi:hypothetical protein